ncbi:MAG: C25 family cysteine peptidase, partial [bacterium]|nr:C25 family cysteine peptidase [bacterium]
MNRTFLFTIVCAHAIGVVAPVAAGVHLTEERNGALSVHVDFLSKGAGPQPFIDLPAMPQVPYTQFLVAIPPTGDFRVTISGGRFEDSSGDLPKMGTKEGNSPDPVPRKDGMLPEEPFDVVGPYMYRKTRVIAINCYGSQVDYSKGFERVWAGYDIHVRYTPGSRTTAPRDADPMLRSLVINDAVFPALRSAMTPERTARMPADPHFDLSPNWLKIRVSATGAYQITGTNLAASGVNISGIMDPTSFRLFTAGGRAQERWNASEQPFQDSEGTWNVGKWMTECDILVEYGGDGMFNPNDRIVFHAVAEKEWVDLYESGASRSSYHRHSRAKDNVYYLSWDDGGGFGGAPGRMAAVGSAPGPGPDVTSFQDRLYFEKDRVERLNFGGDGWVWFDITANTTANVFVQQFTIQDLVTSQPQTFESIAIAPYCISSACFAAGSNNDHQVFYRVNNELIGPVTWSVSSNSARFKNGTPVSIPGNFLVEGTNTLSLFIPRILNPSDFMYFAFFSVFYERMLKATGDRLLFSSSGTPGTQTYSVTDFANSGTLYLFDITDAYQPRTLTGFSVTGTTARTVRFDATAGTNRQYFWAGTSAAFRTPDTMERYSPVDLRNITVGPHLVIVTPSEFVGAANVMKNHRENIMPFYSTPRVTLATTEQVFDNFSGGQPDAMAIRNYCKFLYDNFTESTGAPSLTFLLLLGDANLDFQNNLQTQNVDWVTTGLNLDPRFDAYVTDDWFVLLDAADSRGRGLPDVGAGRLPAGSVAEAQFLVDRVIAYETSTNFGTWRDRVVLVADDEVSPSSQNQAQFVQQSEIIAHFSPGNDSIFHLAPYLEAHKVYLTEFPTVGSNKPGSRIALLDVWNSGALLINYIGHGSTAQLADEQVFVESDVGELFNGLRLPLFMALSCTVGDFAKPSGKSLSEKLILRDGGGTIANITASELTFIGSNAIFAYRIFENIFPYPQDPGFPTPLGTVVAAAATAALMRVPGSVITEENNQKYNLLGDPALRLVAPRRTIRFDPTTVDTLTTGKRHMVRGAVYS